MAFLDAHPEFSLEAVEAPWFDTVAPGMYRMWPHKLLGEGHFAAVMRRAGEEELPDAPAAGEKAPIQWQQFAKDLSIELPRGNFLTFGQSLYLAPLEMPSIKGLKVVRPGLELGQVLKNRFEPAHALALWLKECGNTHDLSSEDNEIRDYLHGEVIPGEKTGWCLVTVDGYSIGWGKGDGRVLKNHYPKGLRR